MHSITLREVRNATANVRRELRAAEEASIRGRYGEAYAAAERAQQAAFDLKVMFAIDTVAEATEHPEEVVAEEVSQQ